MNRKPAHHEVGVIVGRFQVPELHAGHRALFDHVISKHRKVLVVLGCAPAANSLNNPLDLQARMQMVHETYPGLLVTRVDDHPSDDEWSKNLDVAVSHFLTPGQVPLLYGSRDSFTAVYTGGYDAEELVQEGYLSGTQVRDQVRRSCEPNADFRKGVIWASANRWPTVFPCVDVAILNADNNRVIVGQHVNGTDGDLFRFPGGFSDPRSATFEDDAYRELREETGMGVLHDLDYLGSFTVDDFRYNGEPDCIRTLLFVGHSVDRPRDGDDLKNVQFVDLIGMRDRIHDLIIPAHIPLMERLLDHVDR